MSYPNTPRDPGLQEPNVPSKRVSVPAQVPSGLVQEALEQLGSVPDIVRRAGALEVYGVGLQQVSY